MKLHTFNCVFVPYDLLGSYPICMTLNLTFPLHCFSKLKETEWNIKRKSHFLLCKPEVYMKLSKGNLFYAECLFRIRDFLIIGPRDSQLCVHPPCIFLSVFSCTDIMMWVPWLSWSFALSSMRACVPFLVHAT